MGQQTLISDCDTDLAQFNAATAGIGATFELVAAAEDLRDALRLRNRKVAREILTHMAELVTTASTAIDLAFPPVREIPR